MELDDSGFERLLRWLDTDRERAAVKHERMRRRLIRFFEGRGCPEADDLADETFDRVMRRLAEGAVDESADPNPYFYGVASRVAQECRQRSRPLPLLADGPAQPAQAGMEETELRLTCLEHCLEALPPRSRDLIRQYYEGEKIVRIRNRKRLAEELGVSMPLLRLQALRVRERLKACVERCVARRKMKRIGA